MKMTKKFLIGAAVAALVLGLVGCAIGDIQWKDAGSGTGTKIFKVNQKNETKGVIRGMKQVGVLDRAQGTCVIRINNQSNKTEDGMCGFATCFTKNTDGTFNFLVVGVRIAEGGIPQTYASYFFNISEENLNKQNFGVGNNVKEKYVENYTEPYEIVIEKFPTKLENISYDKNGTLTVAITFEQDTDNDINITWRKDVVEDLQAATIKKDGNLDGNYTGTVINTAVAYANKTGRSDKSASGKLYTYANIYEGKTLNAEWRIYDVSWSKIGERSAEDDSIDSVGDIFFQEF